MPLFFMNFKLAGSYFKQPLFFIYIFFFCVIAVQKCRCTKSFRLDMEELHRDCSSFIVNYVNSFCK